MRKAYYTVIGLMAAMSIAAIATGATHHVYTLFGCAIMGMIVWCTGEETVDNNNNE